MPMPLTKPAYPFAIFGAFFAGLALTPDLGSGGEVQPTKVSLAWCWRSLAPTTGEQDLNLAFCHPSLSAVGSESIWLSREEREPSILRWTGSSGWTVAPPLSRPATEPIRSAEILASSSGQIFFAGRANGANGTSALHVARWNGESYEWLGRPLLTSEEPFTHANGAAMALTRSGELVVAWSEERNVELTGIFAARWDGLVWRRLGALDVAGKDPNPHLAMSIEANESIWLSWIEDADRLRVVRWDGKSWHDVGPKALQAIADRRGIAGVPSPSLVVSDKGRAWLLWSASKTGRAHTLALAEWDGDSWNEVPAPRAEGSKDDTIWSAAIILRASAPVVAWSQADTTNNHRFYAAERAENGEWAMLLADLHLAEGVSNVSDIRLAAGDGNSFFVAWDEPGQDGRRTRLVQAYQCAADESPATPPKSVVERDTWPTTRDEAALRIVEKLDEESRARVRAMKKEDLIQFHNSWGMGIRNEFGLRRGNQKLLESCGATDPDECSMVILGAVWQLLQDTVPPDQKR